jgi:hypothetical protein
MRMIPTQVPLLRGVRAPGQPVTFGQEAMEMNSKVPPFADIDRLSARSIASSDAGPRAIATCDHEQIRRWAARQHAEPATGEATVSGPATVDVHDHGAGIRFNFPGFGRFRPITWEEWFDDFDRHQLTFVYEEEIADRAYAIWQARGGGHGHNDHDWFEAKRQLASPGGRPMDGYRLMSAGP